MAPGEIRVVRYSASVSPSAVDGALLIADAMVIADGVSAVQDSHAVVIRDNAPQLQLSLSADRNPAAPSELVTYRLRYSNLSTTESADGLSATVPDGMTFVSATGGGTELGGVVSWPVSVGAGISGAREFTVSVNSGLPDGELLRSEAQFNDSVSGASAKSATVVAVQASSPLDLMITSSKDPVREGTALTITMTVSNTSGGTLSNVVLQAVTPEYMQFYEVQTSPIGDCASSIVCSPGDSLTWLLGSMGPGEIRVVRYSASVSPSAVDGALLVADAMVIADGVSAVQDTHAVVVREMRRRCSCRCRRIATRRRRLSW